MPSWSPDGARIAFGKAGQLATVRSSAPFGRPQVLLGRYFGCASTCESPTDPLHPIDVDTYVAWAPIGSSILVMNGHDGIFDYAVYRYDLATQSATQVLAGDSQVIGRVFADFNFASSGQLAYTRFVPEAGPDGNWTGEAVALISYAGFVTRDHDAQPAPSPAGTRMAFMNDGSGTPNIYVASIDGSNRRLVIRNGYSPDWQPVR